ncbi:MAG: hypothetical protein PSX36_03840 [bacterium]|nr:hypothetical protein [bacterium]
MLRLALIISLVSYCVPVFSQTTTISRIFPGNRKSIPLEIINNHPNYFFLLRYNKEIHDLTIERRAKPDAEILSFCALRLDSVNATWFDYEKLDHLFFEYNNRVYFFFEKILNSKRSVFLKAIDTTGRSTGFLELLTLEKDKNTLEVHFEYLLTAGKNLLIIAKQEFVNGSIKKTAFLFNLETRQIIWSKKLPIENAYTGYATAYECNAEGDLFFVFIKSRISSFKRKYIDHAQMQVPVFFYESVTLCSILGTGNELHEVVLPLQNFTGLHSISLLPIFDDLICTAHYNEMDTLDREQVYFFTERFAKDLSMSRYVSYFPLLDKLATQLTYYDGTDQASASDKDFTLYHRVYRGGYLYNFAERKDDTFYKEILFWKINTTTGAVADQAIIPRKIFFFGDRTRFKSIGEVAHIFCGAALYSLVLENRDNQQQKPGEYRFKSFAKQRQLDGGNLTLYSLEPNGTLQKKGNYTNADFDFVPLKYQSDQSDFVFYLSKGRAEKFAILRWNPL